MKMGDGGFRPAANVQFATTCNEQVIVGMDVVNAGSDMAQLAPMVEQVEQRLGQSPGQWLVDGVFPSHEQIDAASPKTMIYAPVPEPRQKKDEQSKTVQQDKHEPKPGDSPAVIEWRKRMASDEAAEIYLQAASGHGRMRQCASAQPRLVAHAVRQVVAYRASGQKGRAWAEANGVPPRALASWCAHAQRWQARLDGVSAGASATPRPSGFVAARVAPSAGAPSVRVELNAGGTRLDLHWPLSHRRELAGLLRELGR